MYIITQKIIFSLKFFPAISDISKPAEISQYLLDFPKQPFKEPSDNKAKFKAALPVRKQPLELSFTSLKTSNSKFLSFILSFFPENATENKDSSNFEFTTLSFELFLKEPII